MQELRANTQIKVRVGPCVDASDGVTPETGVTLGAADQAELLKNNGTVTADISSNTFSAISACDGYYDLTLATTDTNVEGLADVVIQDADVMLPIRHSFVILSEAAWDSKYVAKDDGLMDVNVKYVGDTLQTANDNGADINELLINLGTVDTVVDAIKAVTDVIPDSGALTDIIARLTTIDAVADAIQAVTDNLPDSGGLTSLATLANQTIITTNLSTVDTVVDAIKAKTDYLPDDITERLTTIDTVVDSIKAVTDVIPTDITARLTTIDTVVDTIQAVTDNLPDSGALSDVTARLTTIDTVADAIKAVTDNLPDTGNLTSLATLANQSALSVDLSTVDTVVDTLTVDLLKYVQVLSRKDAAIATDNATTITAINADGGSGGGSFDNQAEALEAIRDRGDAAWITGGGGGITDILNIQPLIPDSIDLASTATVRLGIGLTNMLDDLPSTAEITPGTIYIDHKAAGGTAWNNLVTAAACSEAAGLIYYDEVFDLGTGYAEGDSIRITFKGQKITVDVNDFEITGSDGWMFQTYIRSSSSGGDASEANQTLILEDLADIKGTGFIKDTDSLVDLAHANAGGGSVLYNYDVTDSITGLPIGDVSVTVSTDKRMGNIIASGRTNSGGRITFYLDPGAYYFWSKKDGYNFTNPDLEVVS